MDHYSTLEALEANAGAFTGAAIAIGNFDGVHLGHRHLLAQVKRIAAERGIPAGILTFEPHPRAVLRPDDPPFRITPEPVKLRRLAEEGIDFVCAIPFDWDLASRTAEDFIAEILKKTLAPAHIVVGSDFRFGQLRKGTPHALQLAGLDVSIIDKIGGCGAIYSSSAIREALRHADLDRANAMLGWDWEIEGTIVKGDQRGRALGYPTANVPLGETLHPAYGIYATTVQVEGETHWRPAATNIGIRPMFELKVGQVEAHILDFDGDIYGRKLRIRPVKKLRGEARFEGLEALIRQIDDDCAQTRALLEPGLGMHAP